MTVHYLKCEFEYFLDVSLEEKGVEVRYDDRNYQVGDILILQQLNKEKTVLTGHICIRQVTHILRRPKGCNRHLLGENVVAMTIKPVTGSISQFAKGEGGDGMPISWNVGDKLRLLPSDRLEKTRTWEVVAIRLGALGQESQIELRPLSESVGMTGNAQVPERLLNAMARANLVERL